MRIKISTIFQVVTLLLLVAFIIGGCYFYKEYKVYKQNTTNMLSDNSRELLLTKKELKLAFDENTKLIMDSMGIKIKNVTNYVQTYYNYHDSVLVTTHTVYDSIRNKYNFMVQEGCWTIGGYVNTKADSITINKRQLNDTLDIFMYHDWDNKILWGLIKWNKYEVAGAWSRCKNDTLAINKFYSRRK